MRTINQALKDLFLGLGGKASELSDNTTISDYIEDLEGAIKDAASGAAEDIIDDTAASATKTYSSEKINELCAGELPTPSAANVGKIARVVSDGQGGYAWSAEDQEEEFVVSVNATYSGSTGSVSLGKTPQEIKAALDAGKKIVFVCGDDFALNYDCVAGGVLIPCYQNISDASNDLDAIFLLSSGGSGNITLAHIHIIIGFNDNSVWYQVNGGASVLATISGESD